MGNRQTEKRESIFDSPWYWAYVFVAAALAVLFLAQGRIQTRQAQIENKYQGRQRAVRQLTGAAPDTPMSTPDNTLVRLGPIFLTLGLLFLLTGYGVARSWSRLKKSRAIADEQGDASTKSDPSAELQDSQAVSVVES